MIGKRKSTWRRRTIRRMRGSAIARRVSTARSRAHERFPFSRPCDDAKCVHSSPKSSARVFIKGKQVEDALHVPRQAVFEKNGKNHVFVRTGDRFEEREVKVVQRTESRIAVEGLSEGIEIALVDPNASARPAASAPSSSPLPGGTR